MISRVAEACFWMHRHMERADAMARLLRVNRSFVLDAPLPPERKWYPLLVVSGEQDHFDEIHGVEARSDGTAVESYLTWSRENAVSLASALYWARENARTVREVVGLDVWEVLNELWLWFRDGAARHAYEDDADAFYRRISDSVAMFQGVCSNTMLHEDALDFMRIGMLLERAGQTARVLDMHHHTFDAAGTDAETVEESALAQIQWLALLRSMSGTTPFFKRARAAPNGRRVVAFLVLDPSFPRSVLHCVRRASGLLSSMRPRPDLGRRSWELCTALSHSFDGLDGRALVKRGVHAELTRIVDATSEIATAVHEDYFDIGGTPPISVEAEKPE